MWLWPSMVRAWDWPKAAVLVVAGLVAGHLPGAAQAAPNFVFVMTDDMDAASLSAMPHVRSLLGKEGATFRRYYAGVSLCCPSRATLLTGKYAHNTKVLANRGANGGYRAFRAAGNEQSTIATWLSAAGYRTAHIGKYLNGFPGPMPATYVPPGWTDWMATVAGRQYTQYNYTLNVNGVLEPHGATPADYGTDVFARKAIEFIERATADGEPFYVQLWAWAPHGPQVPAPRHANLFPNAEVPRTPSFFEKDTSDKPDLMPTRAASAERIARLDAIRRGRLQSLAAVDEGVRAIYLRLERLGILDNTYLIFSSDNGYHLGQHGLLANKHTAYEEDIRIPLVIRGPGIPAGLVLDHLVSNADLAPTVAALAGVEADPAVDGRSFARLFDGEAPPPGEWREAIPVAHWYEPLARLDFLPDFRGVRTRQYTYVEYGTGDRELYDNRADPLQLENLATTAAPDLLAQLSALTGDLATCAAATCREIERRPLAEANSNDTRLRVRASGAESGAPRAPRRGH